MVKEKRLSFDFDCIPKRYRKQGTKNEHEIKI